MSITSTYRLLKKEQPDREKILKKFSRKKDPALLGALANPEHSEAARAILQEMADERGIEREEVRGWMMSEESMYVKPFGFRPSMEAALASPKRRKVVYRSLQLLMLLSWLVTGFACSQLTYGEWVREGINAGQVRADVVERLLAGEAGISASESEIYDYLQGANEFSAELRENYLAMLGKDSLVSDVVMQMNSVGLSPRETVAQLELYASDPQIADLLYATKGYAYEGMIERLDAATVASSDWLSESELSLSENMQAFLKLHPRDIEFLNQLGADNTVAFGFYNSFPTFEPEGSRADDWENLALGAFVGGVFTWYFGGIFSWFRPYRILLLRPFQSKKLSRSLKRFTRRNLAFNGHVTTLSDKYLKESRLAFLAVWIPRSPVDLLILPLLFLGPIRQFQRWLYVSSTRSYYLLKKRQRRRFTLNMFWVQSFNKLLKVRCSDVWWKQAVDLLMFSSQLIVVDLSLVKEGTEWELEKIDQRDLERKTVFIVEESSADYAREVTAKFWPHEEDPPPLFVYTSRGKMLEPEAYAREVARIISGSHLWDGATAKAA